MSNSLPPIRPNGSSDGPPPDSRPSVFNSQASRKQAAELRTAAKVVLGIAGLVLVAGGYTFFNSERLVSSGHSSDEQGMTQLKERVNDFDVRLTALALANELSSKQLSTRVAALDQLQNRLMAATANSQEAAQEIRALERRLKALETELAVLKKERARQPEQKTP